MMIDPTPNPNQKQPTDESKLVHLPQPKPQVTCNHCNGLNFIKRRKDPKGDQIYICKDCNRHFVHNPRKKTEYVVNPEAEYLKDIWDCRCLGIEPGVGRYNYKLNFTSIKQDWIKEPAKLYVKFNLVTLSYSSAQAKLLAVRRFSIFLDQNYPSITPSEINRNVILSFIASLASKNLSVSSRRGTIGGLRGFLDMAYQNEWLDVSRYLVRDEDYPRGAVHVPRFIPEEVMQQLNQHLDTLEEPIMRMVLVIQECGMRVSELLYLNFDCLLQDKSGDWFLRYYQFKMKKDITVPISRETVRVIQEQQHYIREVLPSDYEYLFCSNSSSGGRGGFRPQARPMSREAFNRYLNVVAKTHDIRTASGDKWHFQSHQFRHTVGTRMINNGVPQHIIQKYLGHESPVMTARYAKIHDQTMKEEVAKFQGKVVNVAGQVVEANDIEADDGDLQWFKKTIQAQALPNGSCALPIIQQGCPHANACLTCTHFRTTAEFLGDHKRQLEKTNELIAKAEANGWQRQIEMNQKVKTNLEAIVAGLEGDADEGEA